MSCFHGADDESNRPARAKIAGLCGAYLESRGVSAHPAEQMVTKWVSSGGLMPCAPATVAGSHPRRARRRLCHAERKSPSRRVQYLPLCHWGTGIRSERSSDGRLCGAIFERRIPSTRRCCSSRRRLSATGRGYPRRCRGASSVSFTTS